MCKTTSPNPARHVNVKINNNTKLLITINRSPIYADKSAIYSGSRQQSVAPLTARTCRHFRRLTCDGLVARLPAIIGCDKRDTLRVRRALLFVCCIALVTEIG